MAPASGFGRSPRIPAVTDGPTHLLAVLENRPTPEAHEWLRVGLRSWLLSGNRGGLGWAGKSVRARVPSMPRYLGLPTSPERVRVALRDACLLALADHLAETMGRELWPLARTMHRQAVDFEGRKWACWCDLEEPPVYASEPERLLWKARRMGGTLLPATPQRYLQLLQAADW